VLEIRDLRVRRPRGPLALDGVSLIAHPGEVIAIVGPNGSGKSTLLRTVAGFISAQDGIVSLDRDPLTNLAPHQRAARGIAYAPEHARILPSLSVQDNLVIGAWLRRDREAVARDLERVFEWFPALTEGREGPAGTLSGSARQMLAIGRILMSAPRAILLDEPLAGLDAEDRRRVVSVITIVKERPAVVVLSEHDPAGIREVADRAYGLKAGRVVFSGSAEALVLTTAFTEIYD
jgi:branched-chain amino acid transport system ATP-binding protein